MRSAAAFQVVMTPPRVLLMMASSDEATMAASLASESCGGCTRNDNKNYGRAWGGGAIAARDLRRAQALTGSVKVGLPSGSQNRRIIPVYLATVRLTRVAILPLQDSCWRRGYCGPAQIEQNEALSVPVRV